MNEFL